MRFDPQCGYTAEDDQASSVTASASGAAGRCCGGTAGKAVASAAVVLSTLLAVWIWRQQTGALERAPATEQAPSRQSDSDLPATEPKQQRTRAAASSSTEVAPQSDVVFTTDESTTAARSAPDTDVDVARRAERSGAVLAQGKEMLAIGRTTRAIELLGEAIRLNPQSAEAHYNLGLAYVLQGDIAAAGRERDVVRELDRNLGSLLGNLVR